MTIFLKLSNILLSLTKDEARGNRILFSFFVVLFTLNSTCLSLFCRFHKSSIQIQFLQKDKSLKDYRPLAFTCIFIFQNFLFFIKQNIFYIYTRCRASVIAYCICLFTQISSIVYKNNNIDQTLVNALHRLLTCEIGGLNWHVITTEYRTHVHFIHM